ncbi:hypothetical protein M7I_0658 [Glarea lozoyensis 74030]|uniref:BTB domain-containing protein n=1 Tax=Glarea lozoyensis (strain ATCC 74030 / MF5533) TaxID=1104152 RepID=H0EDK9_GLAL7|nr:hypothetical protein M7I_0658 [Glarea lozoyensis 74030]
MPPIDDLPLEEQVISFRDIVTLFVGPEKTKYSIHKTLLQDTRFFELAFSGPYKETQTQEIWLQDETPATMTFFAGYLYRKNIPTGNTQQYLNDLYDFYIFAEKIDHRNLMDATMDMMRLTSHTFDKYIDTDLLVKVYNNTFAGSGLRKAVAGSEEVHGRPETTESRSLAMKKRKSAVGDDSVMEMHEEIVEMEKGEDEMMEDENVDGEPMAEEEITDDENVDGWPMAEEDLTEDENVDEEPMEDSEGEYEEDLEASLAAMKKELAADRVGEVEVEEEL